MYHNLNSAFLLPSSPTTGPDVVESCFCPKEASKAVLYSIALYLDYRYSESFNPLANRNNAFTWRAIERKKAE